MKAVMISIQPKQCENIANGEQTIVVRKTRPKLETPFKCYIYCTKNKPYLYRLNDDNDFELANKLKSDIDEYVKDYNAQNNKVIGEFICDKIDKFVVGSLYSDNIQKEASLSYSELIDYYYNGEPDRAVRIGYGWHISDLKIYDEPKELSEFCKGCNDSDDVMYGSYCPYCDKRNKLTRPPQSWCYVKEDEGYRKTSTSDLATDTQKAFKEGYEKGVEDMQDQLDDVKNHADTFHEENVRLTELTVWQAKKIKELEEKLNGE